MTRIFGRSKKKVGVSPGTVEYHGEKKVEQVRLSTMSYDETGYSETQPSSVEDFLKHLDTSKVTWLNVDGLHETHMIQDLGQHFGLHPLVQEDIVNTRQRSKIEDYQDLLYLVVKMPHYDEQRREVKLEQISLILGPRYVLSFQETLGDVFDPVRGRIRQGKGRIRKLGADYLAYALLDAVIDSYFVLLEKLGEDIENLEEELLGNPTTQTLQEIHQLKRETLLLRKSVWPLREVLSLITRAESELIREGTQVFLRDVYDHTIQVVDAVESFRDMISGLQDLYLSSISNRMNEVMKVLTIIATIFVPLTFVAGIYGMNFEFMPELKWKWSYLIFWLVIVCLGGMMLTYFRKKRWL